MGPPPLPAEFHPSDGGFGFRIQSVASEPRFAAVSVRSSTAVVVVVVAIRSNYFRRSKLWMPPLGVTARLSTALVGDAIVTSVGRGTYRCHYLSLWAPTSAIDRPPSVR